MTRTLAFFAALTLAVSASAVTIDMVTVGNPGNANDPATAASISFGGVNYEYNIGKYEVTVGQIPPFSMPWPRLTLTAYTT